MIWGWHVWLSLSSRWELLCSAIHAPWLSMQWALKLDSYPKTKVNPIPRVFAFSDWACFFLSLSPCAVSSAYKFDFTLANLTVSGLTPISWREEVEKCQAAFSTHSPRSKEMKRWALLSHWLETAAELIDKVLRKDHFHNTDFPTSQPSL